MVTVLLKKLEPHAAIGHTINKNPVIVSLVMKTLLTCIELLPNTFKQAVAAKQTGLKRDSCSEMLELLISHLPSTPSGQHCKRVTLQILS
jgi:hypothetical protein